MQWNTDNKYSLKKLSNMGKFSEAELKIIQKEFIELIEHQNVRNLC
jgi:hypothetical protein